MPQIKDDFEPVKVDDFEPVSVEPDTRQTLSPDTFVGPKQEGLLNRLSSDVISRSHAFASDHPKIAGGLRELVSGPPEEDPNHPIQGPGLMKIPGLETAAEKIKNAGINSGNWWGGFGGDVASQLLGLLEGGFDPRTAGIKPAAKFIPPNNPDIASVAGKLNKVDFANPETTALDKTIERNAFTPDKTIPQLRSVNAEVPKTMDQFGFEPPNHENLPYPYNVVPDSLRPPGFGTDQGVVGNQVPEAYRQELRGATLQPELKPVDVPDLNSHQPIPETDPNKLRELYQEETGKLKPLDNSLGTPNKIKFDPKVESRWNKIFTNERGSIGYDEDRPQTVEELRNQYNQEYGSTGDEKRDIVRERAYIQSRLIDQMPFSIKALKDEWKSTGSSDARDAYFKLKQEYLNKAGLRGEDGLYNPEFQTSGGLARRDPAFQRLLTDESGVLNFRGKSKEEVSNARQTIIDSLARGGRISLPDLYQTVKGSLNPKQFEKVVDDIISSGDAERAYQQTKASNLARDTSPMGMTPESNGVYNSPTNALSKLMQAIQDAKPVRADQELSYTQQRAERFNKAFSVKSQGEQRTYDMLDRLKGEYDKVDFQPIRDQFSQLDIDGLMNQIDAIPNFSNTEKLRTRVALGKMLGQFGGQVPQANELELLSKAFGPELRDQIIQMHGGLGAVLSDKALKGLNEVANFTKSMMASIDLSAPLRQGLPLWYRPEYRNAFKSMFGFAKSEETYKAFMDSLQTRPLAELGQNAGLKLTRIGTDVLEAREEQFLSTIAEKYVPGVRASERAYVGFLDKLRADTFDSMVNSLMAARGNEGATMQEIRDIAKFVNVSTGRGSLGALEPASKVLNTMFFSPRLISSRLTMMNPVYYTKLSPVVRKEALKALFAVAGAGLTIDAATTMAGKAFGLPSSMSLNPTSADFLKARIDDTRADAGAGFQQYIVAAAKLLQNESTSTQSGITRQLGSGYNSQTRADVVREFGEKKLSPLLAFAWGMMDRSKDRHGNEWSMGRPWNTNAELASKFVPILIQDVIDLAKSDPKLLPLTIPDMLGVGVQTYTNQTGNKNPGGLSSITSNSNMTSQLQPVH